MSSAIHELQVAIANGKEPITNLLRRAKLIAAKLNLSDATKWVDSELKGYDVDDVPAYRQIHTSHVEILHPRYGWRHAGNLSMKLPSPEPISQIENLSKEEIAVLPLRENFALQDVSGMGTGMAQTFPQRIVIPTDEFRRILSAVTDELLEWTLELERRGIKGENMEFNENEKRAATHINIGNFTGVLGNVTGSQVTIYDYSSISQMLVDRNIPKADRRELEDIMDELKTAPADKKPSLLARGEQWIVKHGPLLGTAAEAVGKAIGAAIKQ